MGKRRYRNVFIIIIIIIIIFTIITIIIIYYLISLSFMLCFTFWVVKLQRKRKNIYTLQYFTDTTNYRNY